MNFQKKTPSVQRENIPVKDSPTGLTSEEAQLRLRGGWGNGMAQSASRSEKRIILENCLTFFNLVFVILAVIVALSGSSVKNMTFLIVVICNTVIGCYQEIRAKRAVDKLKIVAAQKVLVVREGAEEILSFPVVDDSI